MKTLIAKNPDDIDIDFALYDSFAAKKKLLEINSQYPEFVKAFEQFLTLPAHYVAHEKSDDGLLMGVKMPVSMKNAESAVIGLITPAKPRINRMLKDVIQN